MIWNLGFVSVLPSHIIPPDPQEIPRHLEGIGRKSHPASLGVPPYHGHLFESESPFAGHIENLPIKTETLDGLFSKEVPAAAHFEELESALGIGIGKTCGKPYQSVEYFAAGLTKPGLANLDV